MQFLFHEICPSNRYHLSVFTQITVDCPWNISGIVHIINLQHNKSSQEYMRCEWMEYLYEIQLDVPLGIRKGTMSLNINDNEVSGELEVLGNKETFEGSITDDGIISITGMLVSLVRHIPYKGIGNIQSNTLKMLLCVQDDSYKLTGHQVSNEKGSK